MSPAITWRRYSRAFKKPLRVSAQQWEKREGILIKLRREDGSSGYGEIAPIPWFPVESLETAESFFETYSLKITPQSIQAKMPCTAFALSCALAGPIVKTPKSLECATLLPAGKDAIASAQNALAQGTKAMKWKVGVYPINEEIVTFHALQNCINDKAQLRLDANGGLSEAEFEEWAKACKDTPPAYIEQPLPCGKEEEAYRIAQNHKVALAFDESACTLNSLVELSQNYPEAVYTIKPSQVGDINALQQFLGNHSHIKRVYSSAFETTIGLARICQLANKDSFAHNHHGLGTSQYFHDDGLGLAQNGPSVRLPKNYQEACESIWKQM